VIVVQYSWSARSTRPRIQHDCHHDTKVKPEAATAVIELLMMGGKTPETCWAVNKRWDNELKNCRIRFGDLFELNVKLRCQKFKCTHRECSPHTFQSKHLTSSIRQKVRIIIIRENHNLNFPILINVYVKTKLLRCQGNRIFWNEHIETKAYNKSSYKNSTCHTNINFFQFIRRHINPLNAYISLYTP
jgi:hypothetical protein